MLYGFNDPNNSYGSILQDTVPEGAFQGRSIDVLYTLPVINTKDRQQRLDNMSRLDSFLQSLKRGDILITSTITNFSLSAISALDTVDTLHHLGVRVIALQERFDTDSKVMEALSAALPALEAFHHSELCARQARRRGYYAKAIEEGSYKGVTAYQVSDFPEFKGLYSQYKLRMFSKTLFAKRLGVSRPTLDKLIKKYETSLEK